MKHQTFLVARFSKAEELFGLMDHQPEELKILSPKSFPHPRTTRHEGCKIWPSYGGKDGKAKYCAEHSRAGDTST